MIALGLKPGERILITGSGGLAGVNFVRAMRASKKRKYYLAGTDYNKYHLVYPDLDSRYLTPKHSDPTFVRRVASIAKRERVSFLHPQPSSEALVLSRARERLPCAVFLPPPRVMEVGQDKLLTQKALARVGLPVARTIAVSSPEDIEDAFTRLGRPLWVRARRGAGGRLSLLCADPQEARHWIGLWTHRGTSAGEFILQEYLPGRNIAWDSLWKDGRLVTSYARERLEYPFKHISPSGITGTPSVARIVRDRSLNDTAEKAVRAIDPHPGGAYSIDAKESAAGEMCITEVDAGKFHSTMPLWGYIAVKHLKMPWYANLADLYVRLGLAEDGGDEEIRGESIPRTDLLPEGYYLLRDMDVGAFLWREDGWKERVL